jgi:hypothetical protein
MKSRHEQHVRELLSILDSPSGTLEPATAVQIACQVDPGVADFAIVTALPRELYPRVSLEQGCCSLDACVSCFETPECHELDRTTDSWEDAWPWT